MPDVVCAARFHVLPNHKLKSPCCELPNVVYFPAILSITAFLALSTVGTDLLPLSLLMSLTPIKATCTSYVCPNSIIVSGTIIEVRLVVFPY